MLNVDILINIENESNFNLSISEILHAIKYESVEHYEELIKYKPSEKNAYSKLQYLRLAQLAAILDFKLTDKVFYGSWFKSSEIYLDEPYFVGDCNREFLFLFAPQQLMRHNVFYDANGLDAL